MFTIKLIFLNKIRYVLSFIENSILILIIGFMVNLDLIVDSQMQNSILQKAKEKDSTLKIG